jgi:hypothetical protein
VLRDPKNADPHGLWTVRATFNESYLLGRVRGKRKKGAVTSIHAGTAGTHKSIGAGFRFNKPLGATHSISEVY